MLLVITYSQGARGSLRNVVRTHEAVVIRRFGRAALLRETELGAFLALRLRAKHGGDVQIERTGSFNEFEAVPEAVRDAAAAYEERERRSTPYAKFAVGRDLPAPDEMRGAEL